MTALALYWILLQASVTSFSGTTSLPLVRQQLVLERHVLTDQQLNAAVAISRMGPGANGGYVIPVGYYVLGPTGAGAGYLSMITPAFLAVVLLRLVAGRLEHPRWQGAIRAISAAGAGLMLASAVPLAQAAIRSLWLAVIFLLAFYLLAVRRIETLWVIASAALAGLAGTIWAASDFRMLY